MPRRKDTGGLAPLDWTIRTIGARGATPITSANRGPVKFWLCQGESLPRAMVDALALSDLDRAWNDTTDAALATLKHRAAAFLTAGPSETPTYNAAPTLAHPTAPPTTYAYATTTITHHTTKEPTLPLITATDIAPGSDVAVAAAALAAALAAQRPQTAPLDEDAVRVLIDEEAGSAIRRATDATLAAAKAEIAAAMAAVQNTPRALHITTPENPGGVTIDTPHPSLDRVLKALSAGVNVMLVGPAGCGKTTLAEQAAKALSLRLEMTGAVDSPYALRGFTAANGEHVETGFLRAFRDGAVFLFDEMDGSDPGALLAFNAALANGHSDFPCGVVEKHADFRVIAAANTYGTGASREYVGRSQLDAASLDRFAVIPLDYDENFERRLMGLPPIGQPPAAAPSTTITPEAWCEHVHKARAAVRKLGIRHVVSTRAILTGARLIAAGWSKEETEESVLWRGLDAAQIARITTTMKGA